MKLICAGKIGTKNSQVLFSLEVESILPCVQKALFLTGFKNILELRIPKRSENFSVFLKLESKKL